MNLQDLKQKLNESGFSAEVLAKLNEILDAAIAKGSLDAAAKQQMMQLVDLDVEEGQLEADTMEKIALTLDSLADETENAVEMNDEAEARVEADVNDEVAKVEMGVKKGSAATVTMPAAPTM